MLVGRWFQDKTYDSFSFDRDYKSYFPLGVTLIKNEKEETSTINKLKKRDKILIRQNEMIPADAFITEGEGILITVLFLVKILLCLKEKVSWYMPVVNNLALQLKWKWWTRLSKAISHNFGTMMCLLNKKTGTDLSFIHGAVTLHSYFF
jgi:Cation transport ATPase